MTRQRRTIGRAGPGASGAATTAAGSPGHESAPPARPVGLRIARLHLRMGSLSLARAELEAYAGRGALDEDALADLAEARWRTGDLAGAGEAAAALLETGRPDPLSMVIAAEAVAAQGRPGEARRLAARALEHLGAPLDQVFAGIARSSIWPSDPLAGARPAPPAMVESEGPASSVAGEDVPGADARSVAPASVAPASVSPASVGASAAVADAAVVLAAGMAALDRGAVAPAVTALGLAMRLDPSAAGLVLAALGSGPWDDPALALLAGDALAELGRETEARAVWAAAAAAAEGSDPTRDRNARASDDAGDAGDVGDVSDGGDQGRVR
jgi:hypothetical protein